MWAPRGSAAIGSALAKETSSEMDVLAEAGVTNPIDIGGRHALLEVERALHGVRLAVRMHLPPAASALVQDVLIDVELGAPGDTRIDLEGDELVFTRTVLPPVDVRRAGYDLAKVALVFTAPFEELSDIEAANASVTSAAPPTFAPPPSIEEVLGQYVVVSSAQSAWEHPDGSTPEKAQLVPGQLYTVVERVGDWARVRGPNGGELYTDGRSLEPATGEGRR
jgi:hypothetical protein